MSLVYWWLMHYMHLLIIVFFLCRYRRYNGYIKSYFTDTANLSSKVSRHIYMFIFSLYSPLWEVLKTSLNYTLHIFYLKKVIRIYQKLKFQNYWTLKTKVSYKNIHLDGYDLLKIRIITGNMHVSILHILYIKQANILL